MHDLEFQVWKSNAEIEYKDSVLAEKSFKAGWETRQRQIEEAIASFIIRSEEEFEANGAMHKLWDQSLNFDMAFSCACGDLPGTKAFKIKLEEAKNRVCGAVQTVMILEDQRGS